MLTNQFNNINNEKPPGFETIVAIPIESFKNTNNQSIDYKVVQNVVVKTLPNGTMCLMNEENELNKRVDVIYIKSTNSEQSADKNVNEGTTLAKPKNQVYLNPFPKTKEIEPTSSEVKFKCIKCEKEFETIGLYRKHKLWHRNVKKFKCTKCSAVFNNENNIKIHMAMHSQGKPTCPVCNVSFQRLASLKSHLMMHQVEELFTCEECNAEFDTEDELIRHEEIHVTNKSNENKSLVCPYCKLKYEDVNKYKEHLSFHIKMKKLVLKGKRTRKLRTNKNYSHICQICKKSFAKASLLERHERVHSGEKPFVCQYCKRGFTQKGTLQVHLNQHSSVKLFECTLCPAKFNQKGNLRVHIMKTHTAPSAGEKVYKCNLCACIFKKVASLNGHVTKVHTTPTIETVINKLKELDEQTTKLGPANIANATKEKNILNSGHINQDNVSKELLDKEVPKQQFQDYITESGPDGTVKRYLVEQKIVEDVRWYCCGECSKQCKKPSDLIRHIRVHTLEKPFECELCGSCFALKSTLNYHVKTHIAPKVFKCKKCNITFSTLSALNHHLRKHYKNYLPCYHCTICKKKFTTLENANFHKAEHGENQNGNIIKTMMKQPLSEKQYGSLPPKRKNANGNESTKVQPHVCSVCGAKFTRLINFKRHTRVHDNGVIFKCGFCTKTFISSHMLIEHLKFHNNIKNFKCKKCHNSFATEASLKRHVLVHNNNNVACRCIYCDKAFKTVLLCKMHMKKVHHKDISLQELYLIQQNFSNENTRIEEKLSETLTDAINSTSNEKNTTLEIPDVSQIVQDMNVSQGIIIGQQFYQIPSNSIQILTEETTENHDITHGDANSQVYQAVYINCEDMDLTDSNFGSHAQLKLQNDDSLLLNTISDLQDNNDLFNVDEATLKTGLNLQNNDVYQSTTNQMYSTISNENNLTLPSINEISTKLNRFSETPQGETKDMTCVVNNLNLNSLLNINSSSDMSLYNSDAQQFAGEATTGENSHILNVVNVFSNADSNLNNDSENSNLVTAEFPLNSPTDETNLYEDTDIICTQCNKMYSDFKLFKEHSCEDVPIDVETETSSKKGNNKGKERKKPDFECLICNKVMNNRSNYMRHLSSHKPKLVMLKTCKFCQKDFKKPSDLKRHLRTHTGEKPFVCDKCDKKFALKSTLESHMRTHDAVIIKEFKCDVCNTFFSVKSSLKVHMHLHTGKRPHSCSHCPMTFRTSAHKKSHEFTQHVLKNKKKRENKASKITNLLASVAADVENHGNQCTPMENIQFNDIVALENSELNNELQQETLRILNLAPESGLNAEPIQIDPVALLQQLQSSCVLIQDTTVVGNDGLLQLDDITLLNFKTVDNNIVEDLKDHFPVTVKSHQPTQVEKLVKPRNLECDICHKMYASKDVLRKHKKIHGRLKMFPCTKCDKGFDKEGELEQHLKLHLGYRPYSCVVCTNSFGEEQSLKTHMKRIHRISNTS